MALQACGDHNPPHMTPVLRVRGITKYFGRLPALQDVSFEVPPGSVFGILGPNGSGKTTLLGIVTDVLRAQAGTYAWFDRPGSTARHKDVGALLETPNFYPYLSVADNLRIAAAVKGCAGADGDRVLKLTGLSERRHTLFRSLSLGMKQRLAIASALLGDPPVLLLDEPTNGLDPRGIADIRELLRQAGEQGKTVIMASHLLDEVEKVCTHVLILKQGRVLTGGPVEEVLGSGERLVAASADLDRLQGLLAAHPAVRTVRKAGAGLQVELREPLAPEALNAYCFQHGVVLSMLRRQPRSLETTFMEWTGTATGPSNALS